MAFTDVTPINFNIAAVQGQSQIFKSSAAVSWNGTPVNLSTWVSAVATAVPSTPNPTSGPVTFGTVTLNSDGTIQLVMTSADFPTQGTGSATLLITAKPTSTDAAQVLSTGTLQLQAG